jgi:eukaryotic-like serine/threonine-protein kinase
MTSIPLLRSQPVVVIGRYVLYEPIASGGMATVHLARLVGPVGFSRTVAIKRLHPHYASDPEFSSMFLDEARLAARIRHPNVVPTLDVVAQDGGLFLVMDYVQGESLARLIRAPHGQKGNIDPKIGATIIAGALHGLHAAHEATGENGEPLGLVHRDVSPQNILVGVDGIARVLDFGIAKAVGRVQQTQAGQIKGKLAYMAPEQLHGIATRATDIYSASIVLWETLTGQRLFGGNDASLITRLLNRQLDPPSKLAPSLSRDVDAVVMRGLEPDPANRYPTARDMARAVERTIGTLPLTEVGEWVESMAKDTLADRTHRVAEIERASSENLRVSLLAEANASDVVPPMSGNIRRAERSRSGSQELSREVWDGVAAASESGTDSRHESEPPEIEISHDSGHTSIPVIEASWPPGRRWNRKRIIATVFGVLLLLSALAIVLGRAGFRPRLPQVLTTQHDQDGQHATAGIPTPVAPAVASGVAPTPASLGSAAQSLGTNVAPAPAPPASSTVLRKEGAVRASRPAAPTPPATPTPAAPTPPAAAASATTAAPTAAKKPTGRSPDCAVPFTVDTDGIRHPKTECL